MDRATTGLPIDGTPSFPPGFDPAARGPLDRLTAIAVLLRADDLMEQSEPEGALRLYSRVIGTADRDVSAAGYYGQGNALYRLDHEGEALKSWEQSISLGETPVSYRAWRQVAAARVRNADLRGALDAYRECEKRAPREDRAEIASRLGWLNKEIGNTSAASKYFARSRGDTLPPFMTYLIIAITVVASLSAMSSAFSKNGLIDLSSLEWQLALQPLLVAHGDYYRLLSVTLVHDPTDILHVIFNMYALWFAGQLVEKMYGSWVMFAMYCACGIAASATSYAFGPDGWSVGASGAIFGLFGVILVGTRLHHAVLDARSRSIASQIGVLIVINLAIGFSGLFDIDNFAHVGGLVAGLWLGLVLPPGQVQTLSSVWQAPRGVRSPLQTAAVRVGGVAALAVVVAAVVAYGTFHWQASPDYQQQFPQGAVPAAHVIAAVPGPGGAVGLVVVR